MSDSRGSTRMQAGVSASSVVLLTLAASEFLMTLDSSAMNVAIASVAKDLGTTVTGVQAAITCYTLVMASLMITGGKLGQLFGRKRAFSIGLVIYGIGSLIAAIAPSLGVLILGWSVIEGVGAALILPTLVALVASNFGPSDRPRAYGLLASAGAIAVAAGPLVGGLFTTYASWRWVFGGEVLMALMILAVARRIDDAPAAGRPRLDLAGTALSALGLAMIVFGILKAGSWGFVLPAPDAPQWLGLSPSIWLMVLGGLVLLVFLWWEKRQRERGGDPLIDTSILSSGALRAGLTSFFFLYLVQAGVFFAVPLFLSVSLGLSAIATGVRALPLSLALLISALAIPKLFPNASPRRVAQLGFLVSFLGILVMIGALHTGAGADIVTWPMLLIGIGSGALASQLGSVTVSSVPDERSGDVGGLQNTLTNLGSSIGTALAGAVLIAGLTASLAVGIQNNPAVPADLKALAKPELAKGVPFLSDKDLREALEKAGVPQDTAAAVVHQNATARIDALRSSLSVIALIALIAVFFSFGIPTRRPREGPELDPDDGPHETAPAQA